jgi:hypothetical protein
VTFSQSEIKNIFWPDVREESKHLRPGTTTGKQTSCRGTKVRLAGLDFQNRACGTVIQVKEDKKCGTVILVKEDEEGVIHDVWPATTVVTNDR